MSHRIGIYPGSFDPPTNGHTDIALRAGKMFDKLVIAVTQNANKSGCFGIEERMQMLTEIFKNESNIEVKSFSGLLIDFVASEGAASIVRGLRAVSDFEYELQFASFNSYLNSQIDTIFFMSRDENLFISSSIIKEVARLKGDVSSKVPPIVWEHLKRRFKA